MASSYDIRNISQIDNKNIKLGKTFKYGDNYHLTNIYYMESSQIQTQIQAQTQIKSQEQSIAVKYVRRPIRERPH